MVAEVHGQDRARVRAVERIALGLISLALILASWLSAPSLAGPRIESFSVNSSLTEATIGLTDNQLVAVRSSRGRLSIHDGNLTLPLDFTGPEIQKLHLLVAGEPLDLEFYPRDYYASIGQDYGGTVLLVTSLPRASAPASLPADAPDAYRSSDASAWEALGETIQLPASIDALFAQFDRYNDPSVGTLCSDGLDGVATFAAMRSGSCFIWCSGYSRVLTAFLRWKATPARLIGLDGSVGFLPNGIDVQSSEAHQSVERWDGDHWALIDPSFRILSVTLDGRTLGLDETIAQMAGSRRGELVFTRWVDGSWRQTAYRDEDPAFLASIGRYFSADKELIVSAW